MTLYATARELCWLASRQASGQHAHPMARQAGCQREAGQPGSRLWKLASHRAMLDDSIAKPAGLQKKKCVKAQTPDKQTKILLACQSATEASSSAAQLCTKQFARRLASKPGPTFGPSALSGTSHPIGRLLGSRQGPQAIARQPASHFHNFSDAKPRNNI